MQYIIGEYDEYSGGRHLRSPITRKGNCGPLMFSLICPPHLLTGFLAAVVQTERNSSLMIRRTTSSVTGLLFVATCLSASLIRV